MKNSGLLGTFRCEFKSNIMMKIDEYGKLRFHQTRRKSEWHWFEHRKRKI